MAAVFAANRTLVAYAQRIVAHGSHCPVIDTNDTLVIVSQSHTADLCKEAVAGGQLAPGLVDTGVGSPLMAPRTSMLDSDFGLQPGTLVVEGDTLAVEDEGRLVFYRRFIGIAVHAAVAYLSSGEQLQVGSEERVLSPTAYRQKGHKY